MAKRIPAYCSEFDQDQTNDAGRVQNYLDTLAYYRPRGRAELVKQGLSILHTLEEGLDAIDCDASGWMRECDDLLTEMAQRRCGHPYIVFGPFEHSGVVGFYALVESAIEDADHIEDDTGRDSEPMPAGFRGLYVHISDHGNVSAYYVNRRGRQQCLFSVV